MRFYDIALFIFLFNLSLSMIIGMNIFTVQPVSPNQGYMNTFNPTADDRFAYNLSQPRVETGYSQDFNVGDFLGGLGIFLSAFSYSTIGIFPLMNQLFYYAPLIGNIIAIIIYFIYSIGIIQFLTNRPLKVMQ